MSFDVDKYYLEYYTKSEEERSELLFSKLKNKRLYKFVSFTNDNKLNESKNNCFENRLLWISCINCFEYNTELKMNIDYDRTAKVLNKSKEELKIIAKPIKEIDDAYGFIDSMRKEMWENYASDYNGFCLEFELKNTDGYEPVIYCKKKNYDYSDNLINFFKQKIIYIIKKKNYLITT